MENKKRYIKNFIDGVAKNTMERIALEQELSPSEVSKNSPNLKRDRLVLNLINRTNKDQEIDLFSLPAGVNPQQGISYGDLYFTKYCVVEIPKTELTTAQSYTVDWLDEDGTPKQETTSTVNDIDGLVASLITKTNDNWSYYESLNSYFLHKEPIKTFVY